MSNSQYFINALEHPVFKTISKATLNIKTESYVIGGYVRDYILNRGDSKDIDIVIECSGKFKTKSSLESYFDNGVDSYFFDISRKFN